MVLIEKELKVQDPSDKMCQQRREKREKGSQSVLGDKKMVEKGEKRSRLEVEIPTRKARSTPGVAPAGQGRQVMELRVVGGRPSKRRGHKGLRERNAH